MKKIVLISLFLILCSKMYALQMPSTFTKKHSLKEYAKIIEVINNFKLYYPDLAEIKYCNILKSRSLKCKSFLIVNKYHQKFVMQRLGDVIDLKRYKFILEFQQYIYDFNNLSPCIYLTRNGKRYFIYKYKVYIVTQFIPGLKFRHTKKTDTRIMKRISTLSAWIQNALHYKYNMHHNKLCKSFKYKEGYCSKIDILYHYNDMIPYYEFLWNQYNIFYTNFEKLKSHFHMRRIINGLHYRNIRYLGEQIYRIVEFKNSHIDYRIMEFMSMILSTPHKEEYHYTFYGLVTAVIFYNTNIIKKLNKYEIKGIVEVLRSKFLEDILHYLNTFQNERASKALIVFRDFVNDYRVQNFHQIVSCS